MPAANGIKAVDLIVSLLGSLNEKELEQVRQAVGEAAQAPCDRLGHKYKAIGKEVQGWFKPLKTVMLCERCGKRIRM